MKKTIYILMVTSLFLSACNPVGSDEWCEKQKQTPKDGWTIGETSDYTKYCVFGVDPEKRCEKLEKKPKGDWTTNEAKDYAANCVVGRSK